MEGSENWFARLNDPPPIPFGTRIQLTAMPNDPNPIPLGSRGTVIQPSNAAQLTVRWDNGRSLSVLPGIDMYDVIDDLEELLGLKETQGNET